MGFRQIRYFHEVVEKGSFSRAAEENHISQSAISQHIKSLESELGVLLLCRSGRAFTLTPAGEYYYQKTRDMLANYEKLVESTRRIDRQEDVWLRIGYLDSYDWPELQEAIASFNQKYPYVRVQLLHGSHDTVLHAIQNDEIDLVLNDHRHAYSDDYINYELIRNPAYIEVVTHHPLAGRKSVEVKDLQGLHCIVIADAKQHEEQYDFYHNYLGLRGDYLYASNLTQARLLIASNRGYMPVDGYRNEPSSKLFQRIPLFRNGQPIYRTYGAYWKKDNSGFYLEEFISLLSEQFPPNDTRPVL